METLHKPLYTTTLQKIIKNDGEKKKISIQSLK